MCQLIESFITYKHIFNDWQLYNTAILISQYLILYQGTLSLESPAVAGSQPCSSLHAPNRKITLPGFIFYVSVPLQCKCKSTNNIHSDVANKREQL